MVKCFSSEKHRLTLLSGLQLQKRVRWVNYIHFFCKFPVVYVYQKLYQSYQQTQSASF